MPFLLTNTSTQRNQARELLANQKHLQADIDLKQANREFWFKIQFVASALGSVFVIFFLIAVIGLR